MMSALIDFFNTEVAPLVGAPQIRTRRTIAVDDQDEAEVRITVWRKTPASELDEHQGSNEDGFRWRMVHTGITHIPNYKPF